MIENTIAYYCAPALAGIKPANIVAFYKDKIPDVRRLIKRLNLLLNCKDIYLDVLFECKRRVLVIVYRKKKLSHHLKDGSIRKFLSSFGYNQTNDLDEDIKILKKRINSENFPHEIGVFLGYPLHDIYGFIYHRDSGCLFTGEWKVYKNEEAAKEMFKRYSNCRRALVGRLQEGKTLAQIFRAA